MSIIDDRTDPSYDGEDYEASITFGTYQQEEVAPFAVHQCNVCNKMFMNYKGLQQHSVIHTDTKPYICDVCGRGFRYKSNMFEHRTVHTGYTPYVCPFCGKQFRLKGNMKKHMRTHVTSKEELEAAYRPYSSNRRSSGIIPSDALVIRGTSMPYYNPEKKRSVPKLLLGKDPSKWVDMICRNQLIPLSSFDDKIMRATMRLTNCHMASDVLEQAKPLEFEIFRCPICKCECSGREDCQLHMYASHDKKEAEEPNYCTKCMRVFADVDMYRQHQSYHSRVQLMIRNNELEMGSPEVDISQICYSMITNTENEMNILKPSA
ncbi:C2H2-type domain-containing protein [Caenorhabditis elegans]|uniref:C2H2-type domain-containing protein n=1 Tax=Caenorhabditis elegans TaxID=6239 RepID=O02273_CAEEL|nr:C2H2-type domain-containing protein [Caenorhabditis elegans]CAB05735.2 C2H2-type domain-containing protein [Caenorhabditis elegans]|eukprot:NP_492621.2 LSY-2-Like [Caenorhabditis elegans]